MKSRVDVELVDVDRVFGGDPAQIILRGMLETPLPPHHYEARTGPLEQLYRYLVLEVVKL